MNKLFAPAKFFRPFIMALIGPAIFLFVLSIFICPALTKSQTKALEENHTGDDVEEHTSVLYGNPEIDPVEDRTLFLQGGDPNHDTWELNSATGYGVIKFELLLYDNESLDPEDPVDGQSIIWFADCNAIGPTDPSILSPPWGDYPYGLWRCRIHLMEDVFDPNRYAIKMAIRFSGQTDPLNARYCVQEYDAEQERIYWEEYSKDSALYSPVIGERTINITLTDAVSSGGQEIEHGLGDRDPNQWVTDHLGGLLWPISYGGRCFIVNNRNR